MVQEEYPVALVTGGSAGLGLVIVQALLNRGYRVVVVGRDETRLSAAVANLDCAEASRIETQQCDVTCEAEVERLFAVIESSLGRLDVLVNCVGTSDRGLIENLSVENAERLFRQNVIPALLCSQYGLRLLEQNRGTIVNIGSLGGKVGSRYIGGYAIAKHGLAGMTQQLRLELKPKQVHVGLISPGPIAREDAGRRYDGSADTNLPEQARAPGGGARLKGLPPQRVAAAVIRCIERKAVDIVLPRHMRVFIALGHAFPRLGDWLLLKFTSGK